MPTDFTSIYNHHEPAVFQAVLDAAKRYPDIDGNDELLVDVACVALNRLQPRYIRHKVDFVFYLTDRERQDMEAALADAVEFAFNFVQSRLPARD